MIRAFYAIEDVDEEFAVAELAQTLAQQHISFSVEFDPKGALFNINCPITSVEAVQEILSHHNIELR